MNRRNLLKSTALMGLTPLLIKEAGIKTRILETPCHRLKTSLNAFSFNAPLSNGEMDIDDLIDYCADTGFDAVDITGYYFPSYPAVPSDEYIYHVKNKAFRVGLAISGIGVRNDFTHSHPSKMYESIQLVKNWVKVAQKLGAPVIRIFAGNQDVSAYPREEVNNRMVQAIDECVDFGSKHGVIIGLQNHNDFVKTPQDIHDVFREINSPWFGLIMDTGGFRQGDPYADIEETINYSVNWQLKELIFVNGVEQPTDIKRVIDIIKANCYMGYIPIETLGEGDPKVKVKTLFDIVKAAL